MYYRKTTNGVDKSVYVSGNTFQAILTELLPHTNYTISVTAINNATDDSESDRATITGRTKIAGRMCYMILAVPVLIVIHCLC